MFSKTATDKVLVPKNVYVEYLEWMHNKLKLCS